MRFKSSRVVRVAPWVLSCVLGLYFASNALVVDPVPGPVVAEVLNTHDGETCASSEFYPARYEEWNHAFPWHYNNHQLCERWPGVEVETGKQIVFERFRLPNGKCLTQTTDRHKRYLILHRGLSACWELCPSTIREITR